MLDNISLRKIRFDVMDYLVSVEFVAKINEFLEDKDKYKDNIDYLHDLLRSANLDTSLTDLESIVEELQKYVNNMCSIESVEHYAILDYIEKVYTASIEEGFDQERKDDAQEKLYNFVKQMVQVHKLQAKLLNSVPDIMYVGEDGAIYDRETNVKIFDRTEFVNDEKITDQREISKYALQFFADKMIDNQRKMILSLDFDEDGFYLSRSGDDLFEREEKDKITEEVDKYLELLYNYGENEKNEDVNHENELYEGFVDDVFDDVSVNKKELTEDSKERFSRLRDSLKNSSNKIQKY